VQAFIYYNVLSGTIYISCAIEGEGRNDKVLSKGKHLFHKFIGFLLMQSLMLECRHLGFCR
jgi:formaldehyde-activating enzyme involved in methanogenesis